MPNFLAVLFKTVAWPSCHRPQQGSAIAISICNSFAASVASCKLAYRARNLANRRHRLRLLFYLRWTPYPISIPHIQTPYPISMSFCCICLCCFSFFGMRRRRHAMCEYFSWPLCGQLLLLSNFLTPSCPLLHFSLMTFYLVLRRLPKNKK